MKLKYRILIILSLLSAAPAAIGQELVSTTLSRDTILIGDQVEWVSQLKVPAGMTVKIDTMSGYVVPGVELIGDFRIDTLKKRKDFSDVEARATVTSFDSGSYSMPPLVVYFYKGEDLADTLRLEEIPLEVTTVPVDTAQYKPYDLRPQFGYPVTFGEILPWLLGGLLLAGLIVLAVVLIRRYRRNRGLGGSRKTQDPPHIVALRGLEKIRGEKLWLSGKQKQYYTDLTEVLRVYIENRFGIRTLERTSNEIMSDLSKEQIAPKDFEEVSGLFSTADLVKFAKYAPSPEEDEKAIPVAVRFVNDTFLQEIEEEKKDE